KLQFETAGIRSEPATDSSLCFSLGERLLVDLLQFFEQLSRVEYLAVFEFGIALQVGRGELLASDRVDLLERRVLRHREPQGAIGGFLAGHTSFSLIPFVSGLTTILLENLPAVDFASGFAARG